MLIYHIIENLELIEDEYYKPETFDQDGFIHLSFDHQYLRVAQSLYLDYDTLHLLCIDTDKIDDLDKLLIEDLYNLNEAYPHYYKPLNTSSIVSIDRLEKVNEIFQKEIYNE